VYDSARGEEYMLHPTELGLGERPFEDLLPVSDIDQTVEHFLALIGGDGPPGAIDSIRLNAAALAINGEVASDWAEGLQMAADAMSAGEPARLIERMRAHGQVTAKA
jgi:anthranilate phosphoribosyltransferase